MKYSVCVALIINKCWFDIEADSKDEALHKAVFKAGNNIDFMTEKTFMESHLAPIGLKEAANED